MLSCHDTILVEIDDDVAGNRKTKWWRRNSTICGDNYVSRHLHSALYKKTGDTESGPEITWIIIWKNLGPNTMVVYGGTSPAVLYGLYSDHHISFGLRLYISKTELSICDLKKKAWSRKKLWAHAPIHIDNFVTLLSDSQQKLL